MAIKKDINGKPLSRDYEDFLSELLQDPQEAKDYLNAALEDEDYSVFLLALKDVAKAIGVSKIAAQTNLNRENIYRMLSEKGNPQVSSIVALLKAVGVRFTIEIIEDKKFEEIHEESFEVSASVNTKTNSNFYNSFAISPVVFESNFAKKTGLFKKPSPFSAEARLSEILASS